MSSTDARIRQHIADTGDDEIQSFVVIHDQELVLQCEREGRFAGLPSYAYLFVGRRSVSRLQGVRNVIVVRDLPENIEGQPNLLSFTAWYAVARNSLIRAPWVSLLEYDVRLASDFHAKTLSALRAAPRLVGYVPFPLSHPMYLHATPWLIPALRTVHGIDLPRMVHDYLDTGAPDMWTATTNASLSTADLASFVDWFSPVSRVFCHDPIGAHVHERALPVFCMLRGLENLLLPDLLEHRQERSHGILAHSWERAEAEAVRSAEDGQ